MHGTAVLAVLVFTLAACGCITPPPPMITLHTAPDAPAAIGPYSHAAECSGSLLFCSGQIALRTDGTMVDGDAAAQTQQIVANITAVLGARGLTLRNVVKTTVFLADMADFPAMNGVYAEAFGDHRPARSAVAVRTLPRDARVEIEVIACVPAP